MNNGFHKEDDLHVEKRALYEIVADKLEVMILNDSTKFDEALPSESFLSTAFSVSRPVIREALKILKERGLIITKQGTKTVLAEPGAELVTDTLKRVALSKNASVEDVYRVRTVLEVLSATVAAERHTQADIEDLRSINGRLKNAIGGSNLDIARIDTEFHGKIAGMSGNPILAVMLESLHNLINNIISDILTLPDVGNDAVQFHEKIIKSIEGSDPEAASDLMKAHLIASMRNYELYIKSTKKQKKERENDY